MQVRSFIWPTTSSSGRAGFHASSFAPQCGFGIDMLCNRLTFAAANAVLRDRR
jgi:hypothetical protein